MQVRVGMKLQACDCRGKWYDSKVMDERGVGEIREVKVHFGGFKPKYDEWILAGGKKLAALGDPTPDTYDVEQLLKKRSRKGNNEYYVRWVDREADDDSWVPEVDIADDLIHAWNASPKGKAAKGPVEPYVITHAGSIDSAIANELVLEWIDAVGRKGASALAHQQVEWAEKKYFSMTPCPPWLFVALHRALRVVSEEVEVEGAYPRLPAPRTLPPLTLMCNCPQMRRRRWRWSLRSSRSREHTAESLSRSSSTSWRRISSTSSSALTIRSATERSSSATG